MTLPQARRQRLFLVLLLTLPAAGRAELYFDPAMVARDGQPVADLSRFSAPGAQLPGSYDVEVYLNGDRLDARTLRFIDARDAGHDAARNGTLLIGDATGLMACLTPASLDAMGVRTDAFPALAGRPGDECVSPGEFIPQARTAFDFQNMRLDVSIPQAALRHQARGWIAPERWDNGVSAVLLGWQFSGTESRGRYGSSSQYLNLTSGLNLGPWRLRDNRTWSRDDTVRGSRQRWQHQSTQAYRAIIPLRSELAAGDGNTDGDLFDGVAFRGVSLASDDDMVPDTLRDYAPVIRGTAGSNAEVSVRQNGSEVYRTWVPAGAFVINDLYPAGGSGDLEVTVTEAGGAARTFVVPYSSVPRLQREGRVRYAVTAGRFRNSSDSYDRPPFTQATLMWGLPHNVTAWGGTQLASRYRAVLLGGGVNMGNWGAVSADVTHAASTLADGSRHAGQSVRFLYSRSLVSTGTGFELVGYRYSTRGYHTLAETALKGMSGWTEDDTGRTDAAGRPVRRPWTAYYNLYNSRRARLEARVSQNLGGAGSLSLNAVRESYWNTQDVTSSLDVAFSSRLGPVSYGLSWGYARHSGLARTDRTAGLWLSVPLGRQHGASASYSATRDAEGRVTHQAGLNGSALADGSLSWGVSQGYDRQAGGSGNASLAYQGGYGSVSGGYSYGRDYRQVNYTASGGAALHGEGLTLGQQTGDTSVLVAAPGAAGVPLENGSGVRTDWRGYTLMPWAGPYRENSVALDVTKLDDHTEIDNPVQRVVPTRGALVRAGFRARVGFRALLTLTHAGRPLPFGTPVSAPDGSATGITGDGGQVYLSGLAREGTLTAQWGFGPDRRCTVHYRLPEEVPDTGLSQGQETCR